MYIYFGEFRYEINKQLLYRQEELLLLKKNQAALLDILLEDIHSFHNKYHILDAIWANQDVSQQVVFQTISELRSILGNEAIKTFSKKGYKWNLPIETYEAIKIKPLPIHSNTIAEPCTKQQNTQKNTFNKMAFLFMLVMLFISGFLFYSENNKPISLHILTLNDRSDTDKSTFDLAQNALSKLNELNVSRLQTNLSPSQAFSSPSLALKRSNISSDDWLFWGESFSSKTGAFLHYGLSQGQIHWQGYVHAETLEKIPSALVKRIKELFYLGLFSTSLEW
jgi:DNA-binding winged helix-turn-helix (wHTH) protein